MAQDAAPPRSDSDFHELAGRMEGTVRALLLLVAKLEMQDALA